ncbi:MarR family transcriptional regulator [Acetobacteraceae bacterium KSS8]|uniref:MarR family transcriptional regulator n=1 Tax=Endosaccharibacter trunci TaxID=2812733 RepID=A0ABT1WC40_9PROT|nr:MarR family transcriptional regulator [Acetobacteraceae bacterium KSS8]
MGDRTDMHLLSPASGLVNPIGDHLDFLLRRCHAGLSEHVAREARAYDLRPTEFAVLSVVRQNRNIRPSHLSDMLGVKLGNLSPLLDRLEERGFILRRRALADQRALELQITPAGRAVAAKVTRVVDGHFATIGALMGETEYAVLVSLLRKLHEVVQSRTM